MLNLRISALLLLSMPCAYYVYGQGTVDSSEVTILDSSDNIGIAINDSAVNLLDPMPIKSNAYSKDLRFAQYLITQELYTDADFLLDNLIRKESDQAHRDSAIYYKAWLKYFRQDFVGSLDAIYEIDSASTLHTAASFLKATCFLYEGQYDQSEQIYNSLSELTENEAAVKTLNLAGIALLTRDYAKFDSINSRLPQNNFMVSTESNSLAEHKIEMSAYKRKSPWIAGFLSAIVPGLGKYYVGYRGTPFGALTLNIPLAAIAVETFLISGWTGIPFLIAAPLFGVFYIGNIWGSALSPYAHEKEFYDEMDHNILYDLHIPTRRIF